MTSVSAAGAGRPRAYAGKREFRPTRAAPSRLDGAADLSCCRRYVIQKMGMSAARRYFVTGEPMTAEVAQRCGIVSEVVKGRDGLAEAAQKLCDAITLCAPKAVAASKALVFGVAGKEITDDIIDYTADQLATIRVQDEAVAGMKALLAREKPYWAKTPMTVSL